MTFRLRIKAICALCTVVLIGCTSDAPVGFRDLDAPIGATTRFDALSFAGSWILSASFTPIPAGPVVITVAPEVAHLRITSNEIPDIAGLYREGAPGELIPFTRGRERLIVMWVDEDFQTAAVGTVSGSFGAVLDRDGIVPPDRANAAREIFDFYGWDVGQLKRTIPWQS